jgi:hypothetical protein
MRETVKIRQAQTEPGIQITLESYSSFDMYDVDIHTIRLCIKNIGQGPAKDITFNLSVESGGEIAENILKQFSTIKKITNGMRYLGPAQMFFSGDCDIRENEIKGYGNYEKILEDKILSIVLKIEVEYKNTVGKKYNDIILISFDELAGFYETGKSNIHFIAQSLGKIEKDIAVYLENNERRKKDWTERPDCRDGRGASADKNYDWPTSSGAGQAD